MKGVNNMICPNCGNECRDNQMFCTKCGTKINTFVNKNSKEENPNGLKEPFEYIVGGLSLEEEEDDEVKDYLKRDLHVNRFGTAPINTDAINDDDFGENHEIGRRTYQSSNKIVKQPKKKKNSNAKKVILVLAIAVISVVISVFATLEFKKATMTKKFDRYYNKGIQYYDTENYKDAKTQFINASNNAFTTEQKIKSYEMVYKVDELIGGYDEEEMKYLEMLIEIDASNIQYYKDLIVLYQNNDLNNKITSLIASAPTNLKEELENFDGTIPTVSQPEGTYDKPLELELSSTDNVTIYFTIDGSDPAESDTREEYKSPIKFEEEGAYTIKALSIDKNGKQSKEMTAKYVLDFGNVTPPTVNLDSGKYTEKLKIEVSADKDCTIYYTTDGTIPTKKSKKYKKAIKLPKGDSLYYFIAINEDGISSKVVTRAYEYTPEYNYDYNSALNTLSANLVSNKTLENKYGEFENGDIAYFKYNAITEIDNESYYIITCEIEDKDGALKSTKMYAVSADTGICYSASTNGDSYSLKNLNED